MSDTFDYLLWLSKFCHVRFLFANKLRKNFTGYILIWNIYHATFFVNGTYDTNYILAKVVVHYLLQCVSAGNADNKRITFL